jgi:Phage P22-like portal protein
MPRPKAGDAEILREAKERFERCVGWESQWRDWARFDTKFANGDGLNLWQWDTNVRTERGNRPCLTYNQVRQHNLQVINDARQNKAQIKITPTGGRASYEAAQVFAGIIRRIEYQSKAVDAYSTATYHQVESGIGYVRVETGYADPNSFDLDLFIRRVADPRTIYMDPDAKEYDKSDMNFCFVFEDIPRDRYEDEYGKEDSPAPATLDHQDGWNDKDHVRVAEYWRRNINTATIHRLRDGTVVRDDDIPDEMRDQVTPMIARSREVEEPEIEWFKLAGDKITDRENWLGKYIPIVPFIGEETVIDGQMDRKGHTRSQIDAQRIYNYWSSAAVEQVALQTKSPYVARIDAITGREEQWATANVKNWSVLTYNGVDEAGQPIPRPEREPPPQMAQAYIQGMTIARQDLMSVTGQYQAELGMPSNERSGIAIQQRQRQGDTATYHYIDNQAKAIRQVGRILLDLIPKIYDTARVVKIMAENGNDSDVMIAPNAPQAHQHIQAQPDGTVVPLSPQQAQQAQQDPDQPDPAIIFNPNVGTYDVQADVGPAYGTQRQEAANAFSQIMQQNPAAFQIVGDFWAQNSDFPGAQELADRLKRGLPPQYKSGVDPQVVQISQQAQQMHQQAQAFLAKADQEIIQLKQQNRELMLQLKDKGVGNVIDDYRAETERLKAVGGIDPAALQIVVRQLVEDMWNTKLDPLLHQHAELQGQLAAKMQPPMQANGNGQANGAPGNGAGAVNGNAGGGVPPAASSGVPAGPAAAPMGP